jgi:flagellar protein FlaG
MNFEAVKGSSVFPQSHAEKNSEEIRLVRKKKAELSTVDAAERKRIQPEELLDKIKSLTEDGLYSVRFEASELGAGQMVIKIVDQGTDEVIRQMPAEEVLAFRKIIDDLCGNFVDTLG